MMMIFINRGKALAITWSMLFLFSCASYNRQAAIYYDNYCKGNYEEASKALDHTRLLKKERNRLLFLLEKGKIEHLLGNYEQSNRYLNEADIMMEDLRVSAKDIAAGTLLNPMMETYQGEEFEKYMVHYYKAINYLQLHENSEALVEARRISLRTYAQEDRFNNERRYTEDAFSLMLQGMIYETDGDINNAFIAYRNAVDVFLRHKGIFYGTPIPEQLKKDLLRTAYANGFTDEFLRYQQLLQITYDPRERVNDGELILFWENGRAPVKTEENLFFNLTRDLNGDVIFVDRAGRYRVPWDRTQNYNNENFTDAVLTGMRIVIPVYRPQLPSFRSRQVTVNDQNYNWEPAQNINELALATLEERRLKEMSKTLTRLFIKKLAEEAAKPKKDEKNEKKKDRQEAVSMGLKIFRLASEKADTRNWQSLPFAISYIRIPLKKGINQVSVQFQQGYNSSKLIELSIPNSGGIQFRNICTIQ